ncbi:Transmembrane protease serine 6 [Entomophthora muscae]|uniref:Transmembrane protease serine 6 n=1 Tax=Entomophthora muscae TaxID=34485 RepID=A0ACC2RED7_9FUNG|nr:Transmembrane protease serine 6 [Entomophthora muscae]
MFLFSLFPLAVLAYQNSTSRVVGGTEVDPPFKYDFVVALLKFGRHKCGGTLYNSNTVITAAHCTTGKDRDHDILIHRHDFDLDEKAENAKRFPIQSRHRHSDFDIATYQNDIAIWKIKGTIPNTPTMPLDTGRTKHEMLVVVGWGATAENDPISSKLLEVHLPPYDMNSCVNDYKAKGDDIFPAYQLCAGFPEGGKDACQGDSGGPLFTKASAAPTLVGVVSWGNGCANGHQPGIYTRISHYLGWIQGQSR